MADTDEQPESHTDVHRFGQLVRERRMARGWSQEALAAEAFANQDRKGYVSRIENGKVPNVTRETVKSIARALEIDPELIPPALRWPEASEVVQNTNAIVRESRDQIQELLRRRDSEIREFGVNEGMLVALARRYSRTDLPGAAPPDNFQTAIGQVEALLEQGLAEKQMFQGTLRFLGRDVLREMLEGAIMERDTVTLEHLLASGVDHEDDDIAYGSALEFLLEERKPEETDKILEIMDLFFRYGADVNQLCMHGASLAHSVAYLEELRILKYLLNKGIDVDRKGWDDQTALACASGFGAEGAVEMLLAHGADPNIPDKDGWTALIEASSLRAMGPPHDDLEETRRFNVCNMLLDHGADITASTKAGETALSEASESEFPRLVKALTRWSERLR